MDSLSAENKEVFVAPLVKFCGISQAQDAYIVNRLRPDFVGFVLWPNSKRAVSADEAKQLRSIIDSDIPCVGVFVNEKLSQVARLLEEGCIQIAQLHGNESEAYIAQLRTLKADAIVWKSFVLRSDEDIARANASGADVVLLDGGLGQGKTFDWRFLKDIERPLILAGGISAQNVHEALEYTSPLALDVSSGIEAGKRAPDGRPCKDAAKMQEFLQLVRGKASQ